MNGFSQNLTSYTRQAISGLRQVKHFRLSQLRKVFSLMGRREKITLTVLLSAALFSFYMSARNFYYSATIPRPAGGGQYTEGILGQPAYINPLLSRSETDLALVRLVYSGLYKYDQNGQLIPDLAEGMPEISQDQKQYTINLKKNARWHNSQPVTADDVVYTIQTLKDTQYKSPYRGLWLNTSAEKLGDYSVKITTKDISAPFRENLTLPIIPKNLWSRVEPQNFLLSNLNLEAIGSGPYGIREINKLPSGKVRQISLEAFADYHLGQAKISRLNIKFYDTEDELIGALHSSQINGFGFMPLGSNLYLNSDQQQVRLFTLPLPQYQVVFFNLKNKILAEQPVRQALSLAINRQEIIDQAFKGNAIPPRSPLRYSQSQELVNPAVDLAGAALLLDGAGWKLDAKTGLRTKRGTVMEINLSTNDSLPNSKAAELIANQWKQLGIKVNLAVLSTKDLTDSLIKPRKFDALLFPQKFGANPDPFLFYHSSQINDPGFNLTGFSEPAADKLITEARTTTDPGVQEQKHQELEKLINEKVPVVFVDETVFIYALDKNIKNVNLKTIYEANQRFYDLPNWYLEEKRVLK